MIITLVLLLLLLGASFLAVMRGSILRAAIALAAASILVTILMFRLGSPLAAVFELSVCAGLITVIFMSTISLTKPLTDAEIANVARERLKRYWPLPVLLAVVAAMLVVANLPISFALPPAGEHLDVRTALWSVRQLDLFGQVLVLLAGVFGVVVLFKDKAKGDSDI